MEKREIKFRAWNKENNKMYYSDFVIEANGKIIWWKFSEGYEEYNIDADIMQFTGLKDKNGKKIYEGDIVKFGSLKKLGIIEFYQCRFIIKDCQFEYERALYQYNLHDPDTFIDIIGNIYENPKLLNIII